MTHNTASLPPDCEELEGRILSYCFIIIICYITQHPAMDLMFVEWMNAWLHDYDRMDNKNKWVIRHQKVS